MKWGVIYWGRSACKLLCGTASSLAPERGGRRREEGGSSQCCKIVSGPVRRRQPVLKRATKRFKSFSYELRGQSIFYYLKKYLYKAFILFKFVILMLRDKKHRFVRIYTFRYSNLRKEDITDHICRKPNTTRKVNCKDDPTLFSRLNYCKPTTAPATSMNGRKSQTHDTRAVKEIDYEAMRATIIFILNSEF